MAKAERPKKPLKPPSPARVAAFRAGVDAEARCADLLRGQGFAIVATRYKTRYGEIDLIARRASTIAFVEVKARRRLADAAFAVTPRQQRRVIDAAQAWLADHPDADGCDLRFDVMLVGRSGAPQHLVAAFDATPEF